MKSKTKKKIYGKKFRNILRFILQECVERNKKKSKKEAERKIF